MDITMLDFDSHLSYQNISQHDVVKVPHMIEKQPNLTFGISNPYHPELFVSDALLTSRKDSGSLRESLFLENPFTDRNMLTSSSSIQTTFSNQNDSMSTDRHTAVQDDVLSIFTEDPPRTESSWTDSVRTGSQFSLPERWTYVEELVRVARQVDPNRPIDSFSEDEISNMKMAADYLSTLYFDDEACYLYALVAKRFRAEQCKQTSQSLSTIVNFARTAMIMTDKAIIYNLLQEQIDGESNSFKKFVWYMLRAYSKSRKNDAECLEAVSGAKDLRIAREIFEAEDIISLLPNDTRALDFAAYHGILRCMSLSSAQFEQREGWGVFRKEGTEMMQGHAAEKISQQLMSRTPGPFEIEDGKMKNPCLRSCLEWCINELPHVKSVPGLWKSEQFLKFKFRETITKEERYHRNHCRSMAEVNAIFTCLWDRSRNPPKSSSDPCESNSRQWINECDTRMGLSPALLLNLVCRMTSLWNISGWKASKKSNALVRNTIKRLQLVSEFDDEALAMLLLDKYVRRHTYEVWSKTRYAMRDISRAHTFEICRKTMMIIVPERIPAVFSSCGTPRMALAEILPTLAPSLDSESLRRMKRMWNRSISNLSLSLNAAAPRSVKNPSISQLSARLANSLKISNI
jgi:hypothetical protein